jgi:DNA-binding response OmpR family regulator
MKNRKILIIEDEQALVKLIKSAFKSLNFEVIMALTAKEGLAKAKKEQPVIILLDMLLPEENGFDCLKDLKDNPETKNIPVIILSNLGQIEEINQGLALGAVDYLVKAEMTLNEVISKILEFIK